MSLLTEAEELTQNNIQAVENKVKTNINLEHSEVQKTKDKELKPIKKENEIQISKEHITVAATLLSLTILSIGGFIGFRKYKKNKNSKINRPSNQSSNNVNTKTLAKRCRNTR